MSLAHPTTALTLARIYLSHDTKAVGGFQAADEAISDHQLCWWSPVALSRSVLLIVVFQSSDLPRWLELWAYNHGTISVFKAREESLETFSFFLASLFEKKM